MERNFNINDKVYHRSDYDEVTFIVTDIDSYDRQMKLEVFNDPDDNAELWDDDEWVDYDDYNEEDLNDSDYQKFEVGNLVVGIDMYSGVTFRVTEVDDDDTIRLEVYSDPKYVFNEDKGGNEWDSSNWETDCDYQLAPNQYISKTKSEDKENMNKYNEDNDDFSRAERHFKMMEENTSNSKSDYSYNRGSFSPKRNDSSVKRKIKTMKAKGLM